MTAAQAARGRPKDGGNLSFGIQQHKSGAWTAGGVGGLWNLSRPLTLSPSHPLTVPRKISLDQSNPILPPFLFSYLICPFPGHTTSPNKQPTLSSSGHYILQRPIMSTSGDGVSTPKASIDKPTTITSLHTFTPSESIRRSLPPVLIDKAEVDPPYLDVCRFSPLRHDLHWIQELLLTQCSCSHLSRFWLQEAWVEQLRTFWCTGIDQPRKNYPFPP